MVFCPKPVGNSTFTHSRGSIELIKTEALDFVVSISDQFAVTAAVATVIIGIFIATPTQINRQFFEVDFEC